MWMIDCRAIKRVGVRWWSRGRGWSKEVDDFFGVGRQAEMDSTDGWTWGAILGAGCSAERGSVT